MRWLRLNWDGLMLGLVFALAFLAVLVWGAL